MSSKCKKDSVGLRIRGCLGSIPTRGNILPLDFFHIVKPLMPILPLFPILSICEKLYWIQLKHFDTLFYSSEEHFISDNLNKGSKCFKIVKGPPIQSLFCNKDLIVGL